MITKINRRRGILLVEMRSALAEFSCAMTCKVLQTSARPAPGKRSEMRCLSAAIVSMTRVGSSERYSDAMARSRSASCANAQHRRILRQTNGVVATGNDACHLVAQQLVDAGFGAGLLVHCLDDHGTIEAGRN